MATLLALPAGLVPRAHTSLSALAFVTALFLGWAAGLWEQLCENAVSAWPVEWFPSVSATYVRTRFSVERATVYGKSVLVVCDGHSPATSSRRAEGGLANASCPKPLRRCPPSTPRPAWKTLCLDTADRHPASATTQRPAHLSTSSLPSLPDLASRCWACNGSHTAILQSARGDTQATVPRPRLRCRPVPTRLVVGRAVPVPS
jgi:hypothetical protein